MIIFHIMDSSATSLCQSQIWVDVLESRCFRMAGSPNCPGQENLGQHPNVIGHYALCMTQHQ